MSSLKKIIEKAEEVRLAGDEEQSYVLYMKFMGLLNKVQKLPEYKKDKNLVSCMIGSNATINLYFERIEQLQQSLKQRYEAINPTEPLAESTRIHEMPEIPTRPETRETVNCKALFDMLEDGTKLLIMDCRSEEHYEISKLSYKYTMNVPENILNLGMTASKIKERLPNESKVFWELRQNRPIIIIMDWSSKIFNRNSPVWHLKQILIDWDQEVEKKPEMLLLEGGYENWKTMYPMLCVNPQFSPPVTTNGDTPAIEDVEYPNWEDIQMKDATLNKSQVPLVDRAMKLNAVKAHETSKTQLELLEENELIMNKSLQNEKELLHLETDFKEIVTDKENTEDSAVKERSLMFKIWELQSKQNDYQSEEKSIREQLEQSKDVMKEPQEMTKRMQVEVKLLELEMERKRVIEEREQKKKEREEALKFARDRKPTFNDHLAPTKAQRKDELILSPKSLSNQVVVPSIPSFDRAAKPMPNITRHIYNDQDFSPVYGRVVSRFVSFRLFTFPSSKVELRHHRPFPQNR